MTQDEIISVLRIIKMSYPNFSKDMTKDQANDMIEVWGMMFADDDARIVIEAVKTAVSTSKFPPSIAEVKEKIKLIQKDPNEISEMEAWNMVVEAMKDTRDSKCFDKLDENIKRVVGSYSQLKQWAFMDLSQVNTVVQSNFLRSYRSIIAHKNEYSNLPSSAKKLSEELNCNEQFKLEDKEVARRSIEEGK